MICARCFKKMSAFTMSFFNTDEICLECSREEKKHPRYQEAVKADVEACERGDYNFGGIGRPSDL